MSETRDQLKVIAAEQIRQKNLAAASFREMGKAAGIKSSSVHYHFKSRDALLQELLQDYIAQFLQELENRSDGITSPRQRMLNFFSLCSEEISNNQQSMIQAYVAGRHELTDAGREELNGFFESLYQWILDSLTPARFLPVPKESLARVVVAAVQGAALADRGRESHDHLQAVGEWITSLTRL
jgi:TetR/AcrR family transcriptional regulator, transcriptional repressor for nem operon